MSDVIRLARKRRSELARELRRLDRFFRVADDLIGRERRRRTTPAVDPFQARFNSGEVLSPLRGVEEKWLPLDASGVRFVRAASDRY